MESDSGGIYCTGRHVKQPLQRFIEVWCNGSISDFESAGEGSTPSISAQRCNKPQQTGTKGGIRAGMTAHGTGAPHEVGKRGAQMEQAAASRFFHTILARRGVKHGERSTHPTTVKRGMCMAGIFTRKAIAAILGDENLTPEERTDQLFSLYGRALDDGYITKGAAQAAQEAAIKTAQEAWQKEQKPVNAKELPEYLELQKQFEGFKTKTAARTSAEFADVKPKFFDRVYDLIDRADGAKPVEEQLADLRKDYEEYFTAQADPAPNKPQFGAKPEGTMPKGETGAVAEFQNAWGFNKK